MNKTLKTGWVYFAAFLALGTGCFSAASDPVAEKKLDALPEGEGLLPSSGLAAFSLRGIDEGYAQMTVGAATNMPFNEVLSITSTVMPENSYDIQLKCPIGFEVHEEELLLLTFYGRCQSTSDESGQGSALALFEKDGAPYTKSLFFSAGLESHWKKFYIPFRVKGNKTEKSFPARGTQLAFNLGFKPQQIELAEIRLHRYPSTVSMDELPCTVNDYEGSEADAAWRKEALARIDEVRKSDLQVRVVDAAGTPVPNAVVNVKMTRHQFRFGTAVNAWTMARDNEDTAVYLEKIKENFNQIVLESTMKWMRWPEHKEKAAKTVEWALANGLTVRGHTTVWPSWRKSPWEHDPEEVQRMEENPELLRTRLHEHIRDITTAYQGKCVDWDVINEPYNNTDFMRLLGRDSMVEWFKLVHQHDPEARLCINDFGILTNGKILDAPHVLHYEDTIAYLLENGAPLQAIGMQGHFREVMTPPKNLLKIFDRFSKFNLPLMVTEFDHRTNNSETQSMYMRDLLIAAFSHPSVDSIIFWGFWDGMHWRNQAPLYQKDWTLKPGGKVYQDLVLNQWWTTEEGQTDADGVFSTRGFMGEYEITVTTDTSTHTQAVSLSDAGKTVEIALSETIAAPASGTPKSGGWFSRLWK